jgi:glycine/D-amino acid oxidase-like deaminating enzyme
MPNGITATRRSPLDTEIDVDVAIIGAGFTGLWTAYYLHQADPSMRVALVEREVAGSGASGRNGGWVTSSLPMSPAAIVAVGGPDAAARMHQAMIGAVDEIGDVAGRLDVECQFVKGGRLRFARSPVQERRVLRSLTEQSRHGIDDAVWLDAHDALSHARASRVRGALFTPNCARIHPARLVTGLCRHLDRSNVQIFERTTVTSVEPRRLVTNRGLINAPTVVIATEAFTSTLDGYRRAVAPLASFMVATEPLPNEVWDEIGLAAFETFNDARLSVIYGQRTFDGRLAFGGLRSPYRFGSRISSDYARHTSNFEKLRRALTDLFPIIGDAAITHRWGGVFGLPRDGWCRVGYDQSTGRAWAGGYAGYGVAASNLAGRTLTDLILERDSELVLLPWVGSRPAPWPREPARWLWLGASSIKRSVRDRLDTPRN